MSNLLRSTRRRPVEGPANRQSDEEMSSGVLARPSFSAPARPLWPRFPRASSTRLPLPSTPPRRPSLLGIARESLRSSGVQKVDLPLPEPPVVHLSSLDLVEEGPCSDSTTVTFMTEVTPPPTMREAGFVSSFQGEPQLPVERPRHSMPLERPLPRRVEPPPLPPLDPEPLDPLDDELLAPLEDEPLLSLEREPLFPIDEELLPTLDERASLPLEPTFRPRKEEPLPSRPEPRVPSLRERRVPSLRGQKAPSVREQTIPSLRAQLLTPPRDYRLPLRREGRIPPPPIQVDLVDERARRVRSVLFAIATLVLAADAGLLTYWVTSPQWRADVSSLRRSNAEEKVPSGHAATAASAPPAAHLTTHTAVERERLERTQRPGREPEAEPTNEP